MALRIYTVDGKFREYNTHYNEGATENTSGWYETVCGMKWDKCPSPYQTCNHIDCAIYVAQHEAAEGALSFLFFLALAIGSFAQGGWGILAGLFFSILAIFMVGSTISGEQNASELKEFKKKQTINGKSASLVSWNKSKGAR